MTLLKISSIFIFVLLLIFGCSESSDTIVQHRGALRNFMHNGDLSAKASLDTLQNHQHLYALGAVENLKGEIQIFDGQPVISREVSGEVSISEDWNHKAALLVWTEVANWSETPITSDVKTYEELEQFVVKVAGDRAQPFPFRLKGTVASLDWHVINWPEDDIEHTHEKHRTSGLYGTLENSAVEILGFYSTEHTGIFTHHTTNMHLHFRTDDGELAGHSDGLLLGQKKMSLYLPR